MFPDFHLPQLQFKALLQTYWVWDKNSIGSASKGTAGQLQISQHSIMLGIVYIALNDKWYDGISTYLLGISDSY